MLARDTETGRAYLLVGRYGQQYCQRTGTSPETSLRRRPLRFHLSVMAMPDPAALVTVANCYDLQEATRMRFALEAAGIAAFIPDELTAGTAPFHFMTKSGVRVQVADEQAEEARRVVAEVRQT